MRLLYRLSLILFSALALVVSACESRDPGDARPESSGEAASGRGHAAHQGGASQTDIPRDQSMSGQTEGGHFFVEIEPKPNPIPFQELFELEVRVFESADRDKRVEGVELDQVRATMPAHNHGMKTKSQITSGAAGTFTVEGLRFHMQGEGKDGLWVIETVLSKGGTIDRAKFDVQCCRP